jgi:hypothetical protein
MIIKGQARGRARQLAAHLLHAGQNEHIRLYECRGTLAQDVEGALVEMESRAVAARTRQPLYHASISPEARTPLSDRQIRHAVETLERKLGLHGQPRVVVVHVKNQRQHIHVVWSRIDAETGTAFSTSWNYRHHEAAARELETAFGHRPVQGAHGKRTGRAPSRRAIREYEQRQTERSGIPAGSVTADLTALWQASGSAEEFCAGLAKAGYVLARGDRRVFVVIDRAGEVHSLARRIAGATTADIRERLRGTELNDLPTVAEACDSARASRQRLERRASFPAAAREVGGHRTRSRSAMPEAQPAAPPAYVAVARHAVVAMVRPNVLTHIPAAPLRLMKSSGKPVARYRSQRAILVAHYAAKISAALRDAPRHEIEAILAALRAEREAALKALFRHMPRCKAGHFKPRDKKRRRFAGRRQIRLLRIILHNPGRTNR